MLTLQQILLRKAAVRSALRQGLISNEQYEKIISNLSTQEIQIKNKFDDQLIKRAKSKILYHMSN